ncbi:hypothetical protein H2O64_05670 [Kordia sp. YSTF-M3]|uniref:Uncharacterized protein n=1 Tax=Kordia aestuariivivens TaxID=2759037 RepID=A0ABR7Q6G2_9FLAO|nr:hypothetical protein [Kordia aestuariivivens]MBC8754150.1 hypothetical protein [Kordia aestuariivivens]
MKKKKLKALSLKKASISKLSGGSLAPAVSFAFPCAPTQDLFTCTWVSELYTACNCEPSWNGGCESIQFPCPITIDLNCNIESVRICEA